jgi:hypothetical protein
MKFAKCFAGKESTVTFANTKFGMWRSPVSALVWGTRGRKFKSCHPDLIINNLQRGYFGLFFIWQTFSQNIFILSLKKCPKSTFQELHKSKSFPTLFYIGQCTKCKKGRIIVVRELPRIRSPSRPIQQLIRTVLKQ